MCNGNATVQQNSDDDATRFARVSMPRPRALLPEGRAEHRDLTGRSRRLREVMAER